ncbi:MAG: TIGR04282 family arsenosugar biosynthesis glycosyltransferase [Opitutae bacterium]|nr:TIGR04282 family arsenosugar biosynthesis glycosyltransferase [Opitutae bacterium]
MTPTIAFMLKAPRAGFVKTRLAAETGDVVAVDIYQLLVERQLAALPAAWPVTIHYAPADARGQMAAWLGPQRAGLGFIPQCAGDLGARIAAAMADEFAHGAAAVIAIGGDCPGLDGTMLEAARGALETADVVLGPAADGGYYLIGLTAPCAALFAGIAWSTPAVLGQTRARIRELGLRATELPTLEDVDDAGAWERAIKGGVRSA